MSNVTAFQKLKLLAVFLFCLQMDVFHPLMIRNYMRKYDMDEPPKLEEPIDEMDNRMKRIKEANADDSALEDKYYR
jgi:chromodomain-helicase-DNA-binding protein 4